MNLDITGASSVSFKGGEYSDDGIILSDVLIVPVREGAEAQPKDYTPITALDEFENHVWSWSWKSLAPEDHYQTNYENVCNYAVVSSDWGDSVEYKVNKEYKKLTGSVNGACFFARFSVPAVLCSGRYLFQIRPWLSAPSRESAAFLFSEWR